MNVYLNIFTQNYIITKDNRLCKIIITGIAERFQWSDLAENQRAEKSTRSNHGQKNIQFLFAQVLLKHLNCLLEHLAEPSVSNNLIIKGMWFQQNDVLPDFMQMKKDYCRLTNSGDVK